LQEKLSKTHNDCSRESLAKPNASMRFFDRSRLFTGGYETTTSTPVFLKFSSVPAHVVAFLSANRTPWQLGFTTTALGAVEFVISLTSDILAGGAVKPTASQAVAVLAFSVCRSTVGMAIRQMQRCKDGLGRDTVSGEYTDFPFSTRYKSKGGGGSQVSTSKFLLRYIKSTVIGAPVESGPDARLRRNNRSSEYFSWESSTPVLN
jgi:hypothetical protein